MKDNFWSIIGASPYSHFINKTMNDILFGITLCKKVNLIKSAILLKI